jgi:hypothetical protein
MLEIKELEHVPEKSVSFSGTCSRIKWEVRMAQNITTSCVIAGGGPAGMMAAGEALRAALQHRREPAVKLMQAVQV